MGSLTQVQFLQHSQIHPLQLMWNRLSHPQSPALPLNPILSQLQWHYGGFKYLHSEIDAEITDGPTANVNFTPP